MVTKNLSLLTFGIFLSSFLQAQSSTQWCGTDQYHAWLMEHDPQYKSDYLLEEVQIQAMMREHPADKMQGVVYTIPVVIHVIHLGEPVGTGSNISDAKILAGLDEMNKKFRNEVGDGVDTGIEFCLAVRDPDGNSTSGITRTDGSGVPSYASLGAGLGGCGADEAAVKQLSDWPHSDYLNIWIMHKVCSWSGGTVAGYGNNQGVVLDAYAGYSSGMLFTHETGHAMGLWHTFTGDDGGTHCPDDSDCLLNGDGVCDTPPHKQYDCGTSNPCTTSGVWDNSRKNYMSYCSVSGKSRFTQGQKDRMIARLHSQFAGLTTSQGCVPASIGTFVPSDVPYSGIHLSAYPNPFNNTTNITFSIPREENVQIVMYDMLGKSVRAFTRNCNAGENRIEWNGTNAEGQRLSPGIYHITIRTGSAAESEQLLLIN